MARAKEKTVHVQTIKVIDPDTGGAVEIEILKCQESGAMVGIDASYLDQDVDAVRNPYNPGILEVE